MTTTPGLFDEEIRLQRLSELGDQLEKIAAAIDFERLCLNKLFPPVADPSKGGRPRYDVVLMFKILLLQKWYELSDGRAEFLITDRLSFQRFLKLGSGDRVPDATTIYDFRTALSAERADTVDGARRLFADFTNALETSGVITHQGSIVDATFVVAHGTGARSRQRNTREENAQIKNGEAERRHRIPAEWQKLENAAKLAQKVGSRRHDVDARWTKKRRDLLRL